MTDQHAGATPDETTPFEQLPARAQVELDRFCDGCGYNLRTQHIRRDPRLDMLLLRCPECGRFHSAADATSVTRPWLRRLAMLGLLLWIVVVVGSPIGVGAAHVGIGLGTLEELTTWRRLDNSPRSRWHREVHDDYKDRELLLSSVLGATFALAFISIALAAVVFHHWRRAWYLVVTAVMAVSAALLVGLIWHEGQRELFAWSHAVHLCPRRGAPAGRRAGCVLRPGGGTAGGAHRPAAGPAATLGVPVAGRREKAAAGETIALIGSHQ